MGQIKVSVIRDRRKDEKGSIEIRVYFPNEKRECAYFSTDQKVEAYMWDFKNNITNSLSPDPSIQENIDYSKKLVDDAVIQATKTYGLPNKTQVRQIYNQLANKTNGELKDFVQFIEDEIAASIELSEGTILVHRETLKRLKVFTEDKYGGVLPYKLVNYEFAVEFDRFLRTKFASLNTVHKHYRVIKRYVNAANKHGYVKYDNYINYLGFKPDKQDSVTEVLYPNDLSYLADFKGLEEGSDQWVVWQMFLFSCYTGLRISDLVSVKKSDIKIEQNEYILTVVQTKLKRFNRKVRLPLNFLFDGKPLKIVKKFAKLNIDDELIFKNYKTFAANYHLKKVMKKAGMSKNISFHVARHTFCTLLAHKTNGNIFTVMEFGGISSVSTAQKYVHVAETMHNDTLKQIEW